MLKETAVVAGIELDLTVLYLSLVSKTRCGKFSL